MELSKKQTKLLLQALQHLDSLQNSWSRWELEGARDEAISWQSQNEEALENLRSELYSESKKMPDKD